MRLKLNAWRPQLVKIVALVMIVVLYHFTRLPSLSAAERHQLAAGFAFSRLALPELAGTTPGTVREVHPSLAHISAWISSVGAAVALNDLDGDGLPNDVCYVHTGVDEVIVAPVPDTPVRYRPFALDPAPLPYEAATTAPMGCLPGDLNEDGLVDILVYYWGRTPVAFLRQPTGAPELGADHYVRREVVAEGGRWYTNAATRADLDGDGHIDLIIGNYFQDEAHILDAAASGQEQMQHSMSRAYNAGRNRLLLWRGAGSGANPAVQFEEAEGALPDDVALGWTLAVGAADLDGDLLPELYFANDFGPDRLLHNRSRPGQLAFVLLEGRKTFTTPNSKILGHDSFKGMGVDFGDLNGDGLLDIYVSNIAAEYALEESHFLFLSTGQLHLLAQGIAPYADRSEPLGLSRSDWGWEARLADFNNDGTLEAVQATGFVRGNANRWPELHELAMGNDELLSNPGHWPRFQPGDDLSGDAHNPFFVRHEDGRYYDLAGELGLDEPQVSRGIAVADVDGDGDLDFAVANQWQESAFYRNHCPDCPAFLGLHLLLPLQEPGHARRFIRPGHPGSDTAGHPAVGATVHVTLPDGRQLVAQVDGGNGHSGVRSPELHFGLGDLSPEAQVTVKLQWRDVNGQIQQQSYTLAPGWYTVYLGNR